MPLVCIDLPAATSSSDREAIGAVVHTASVEVAGAPPNDKSVGILSAHQPSGPILDTLFSGRAAR